MPNTETTDIRPEVVGEFSNQNEANPDDAAVDTVARVCVGYLQNADPWPFSSEQARAQVVAYFVQCYLSRWTPEYPTTGNLPALIPNAFDRRHEPLPPDAIVDALIKIAVGVLRQPSLTKSKSAPPFVSEHVVSFFLESA